MKKKVKKAEKKVVPPKKEDSKVDDERVNEFDFGGLPQRNLKKNLGCG